MPAHIQARIVHQDQFEFFRAPWQHRMQFFHKHRQDHCAVIDRHNNRDSREFRLAFHQLLSSYNSVIFVIDSYFFHLTWNEPNSAEWVYRCSSALCRSGHIGPVNSASRLITTTFMLRLSTSSKILSVRSAGSSA